MLSPCERPVPLLGAGIGVRCGLPSGVQLADWIRGLPLASSVNFGVLPRAARRNPLWVAQQVVRTDSSLRAPLHRAVASHLITLEATAALSPALLALARTPNRPALILSLNYDRLVEKAAVQAGRHVQTLGVEDIPGLLNNDLIEPDGSLRVLHLHGSLDELPEQLVLDADAYAARANDQRVRDLFSALLSFYNLCIIGSSFEEQYLATVLQARRPTRPRHVIVCDATVAGRITSGSAALTTHLHNVLVCDYPEGDHRVLDGFCERLVRSAPVLSAGVATVSTATLEPDPLYQPRRFVDLSRHAVRPGSIELSVDSGRRKTMYEDDLRAERCAVVHGIPGAGKSRLFEHLAVSPSAGERAVLVRLRDVREVVGEPEGLLAAWMAVGCVFDGGGPVPIGAVADGSVRIHLLLDGLDELPCETRGRVAEAVVRVAQALPEQHLTLSSRPSSALEVFPEHWRQFELLCDDYWRQGLLQRAGTSEGALAAQLGPLYRMVEPLLRVPFFLRGMLDLLACGQIPRDGLDLALLLLRRLSEEDQQLYALGPALDRWLERVALTMSLSGSSTISMPELRRLAEDLDLGDPDLAADLLASRSLLLESSGRYAFQHRLFGEGLVAEFLLGQPPEEWLDVLAPCVEEHSMLSSDWIGVTDLLLSRSPSWRAALAKRDSRAAARATPPNAPLQECRRAAQLLWDRAQQLDVWIDLGWSFRGFGLTDGETVGSFIRARNLGSLEAQVCDVLTSGSRFQRRNAVEVIAHARLPDTEALLRRVLVDDPDSTVRIVAAKAALSLKLSNLLGPIERLALYTEDWLEAKELVSVALKLTPPLERLGLAMKLLTIDNHKVEVRAIAEQLTPAALLRWLATHARQSADRDWWASKSLDDIVADLARPTRSQTSQVALVAAVARTSSPITVDFLTRHRHSAVGLIDALDEELVETHEIIDLLLAVGSEALRRHGASRRVLEEMKTWKQALARPPVSASMRRAQPQELHEIMAVEDRNWRLELLLAQGERLTLEVRDASDELKRLLIDELDGLWGEHNLREAFDLQGEQPAINHWAAAVLQFGPWLEWKLSTERWLQVALCGWLLAPQFSWLRTQAEVDWVQRALQQHPCPTSLVDLAELSRPADLPALVEGILQFEAGLLPTHRIEPILIHLAEAGRPDLLRALAGHDPEIERRMEPFLAACGDVPAQRAQLQQCIDCLQAGEHFDGWATEWLDTAKDHSLFNLLATAIALAGASQRISDPYHDRVLPPLQAAAELINPLATVALYDQLIVTPRWSGTQFQYLVMHRDDFVRDLVTRAGQKVASQTARRLKLPVS